MLPARPPWTVRVAGWSARHRWPTFGLWFVATLGIFVASLAAGGTNAAGAVSNDQRARFESTKAYEVFQPAASSTMEASQSFLLVVQSPGATVDDAAVRAEIADITTRLGAWTSDVGGTTPPILTELVDPLGAPAAAGLVSADRTSVRIPAQVLGEGDVLDQRLAPVPGLLDALRANHPALAIHALNNHLANVQIQELVNGGLDS